jgi:hypothetical protein
MINRPSTSTGLAPGKLTSPAAAQACIPRSPSDFTRISKVSLATSGCDVNADVQLTKTVNCTQRSTRSQSSAHAAPTCANTCNAQIFAALSRRQYFFRALGCHQLPYELTHHSLNTLVPISLKYRSAQHKPRNYLSPLQDSENRY